MISAALESELLSQLRNGLSPLPDKPDETPDTVWSELSALALGDEDRLRALVTRRLDGEPLSHITGRQTFMGLTLLAGPEALIPRKETEIVCSAALSKLALCPGAVSVIDVCCGAGNLGLVLASHLPEAIVSGSDISPSAVALANRNAAQLGLRGRVAFQEGDLFAPFENASFPRQADLIICNPPYISSSRVDLMPREISAFEPRLAFDGGPFGVRILTRLVREAPKFLKSGGWLAFEVGAGQGPSMRKILEHSSHYCAVEAVPDAAGETRALLARATSASL